MIIYDLICKKKHKFEGWFKNFFNFEKQKNKKAIICPICNDNNIEILPTAISFSIKEKKLINNKKDLRIISSLKLLNDIHQYIDKNFENVGNKFTEIAIKIHKGEEKKRNIKGIINQEQDKLLQKHGIKFILLPDNLKFDS